MKFTVVSCFQLNEFWSTLLCFILFYNLISPMEFSTLGISWKMRTLLCTSFLFYEQHQHYNSLKMYVGCDGRIIGNCSSSFEHTFFTRQWFPTFTIFFFSFGAPLRISYFSVFAVILQKNGKFILLKKKFEIIMCFGFCFLSSS